MNKDRTGPRGKGPMTGRGRGFCIEFNMPEVNNQMSKDDFFNFMNKGFGFNVQSRELTKDEQVKFLKLKKKSFEDKVLMMGKQLNELEKPLKKVNKKSVMKRVKK